VPTPAERQALLFVAAVAALGLGVRAWRAIGPTRPDPGARVALATQIARVDSAITTGGPRRRGGEAAGRQGGSRPSPRAPEGGARRTAVRPPAPAAPAAQAPIDVDVASVEELDRLPGIGPALAARIVEDRERLGPFGSLEALERVRGIGPALAGRLRPHVTFSLSPRPHDTEAPAPGRGRHP
jgi:competence protein ComEA